MKKITINDIGYYSESSHTLFKLFRKVSIFLVYSEYESDRLLISRHGYEVERLINDKNWEIRRQIAKTGYRLDILVNDPIWQVRYQVAKQGHGLDKLVNDPCYQVRNIAKKKTNEETK